MTPDIRPDAALAKNIREILEKLKADVLPLDAAEAELLDVFSSVAATRENGGISGLRTHD